MNSTRLCLLIAVATSGAGFAAGWFFRGETDLPAEGSSIQKAGRAITAVHQPKQAAEIESDRCAGIVAKELEIMRSLPAKDFGKNMADAWLDYGNPDSHIRRALYLSACDGPKTMAFYLEFKRRKGLSLREEAGELRELFTIVARRDAGDFLKELLTASPAGVPELDSLIHGWANAQPEAAVDWLNALPPDTPFYGKALTGMLWGLAENSPATALKVFEQLDPGDRNKDTYYSITNSVVMNHGLKGLNEMLGSVTDQPERQQILIASMDYGMRQPPGDFVGQMAAHLDEAPFLKSAFDRMASRWAVAAPDAAIKWIGEKALQSGGEAALTVMATQLSRNGQAAALDSWLAVNPNAAGRAAVEAGRRTGNQ